MSVVVSELNLSDAEVLSRKELKKVFGGMGSGGGSDKTPECAEACLSHDDCTGSYCNKCLCGEGVDGGCGCAHVG